MKSRAVIVILAVLLLLLGALVRRMWNERNEARVIADQWKREAVRAHNSAKNMENIVLMRGSPNDRLDAWKPILQADGYSNVTMLVMAEKGGQKIGAVVESNRLTTVGNLFFTSTPPNP